MKKLLYSIILYLNYFFAVLLTIAYLSVFISPADFWLIAFLGLSYPFLLIVNLVFCIFWIFRSNKAFLISLVAIVLGLNTISNYIQIPLTKKGKEKSMQNEANLHEKLKILSYNVRLFNKYNWVKDENTDKNIFHFINIEDPDIICLQEFYSQRAGELTELNIKEELKKYKFSHIYYIVTSADGEKYGIATFSKYPIIRKELIRFEKTANLTIFSDILYKSDTIRVYNNHLQSVRLKKNYELLLKFNLKDQEQIDEFKDIYSRLKLAFIRRAGQVDLISKNIKNTRLPVIICGDFNDTPMSYTFKKMKGKNKDAFVESGIGFGNTYIGKFPSFRIDYIFYDNAFESYNFRTQRVKYSDHYPVSCYLDF